MAKHKARVATDMRAVVTFFSPAVLACADFQNKATRFESARRGVHSVLCVRQHLQANMCVSGCVNVRSQCMHERSMWLVGKCVRIILSWHMYF